ncbi:hypothetical protein CDAR_569671 [Caerostris darwini]|uniref:Uncharacterized protein n=1 Tax=Caerostris darwini TaxID=1538125 RepID=A0AAV4S2U2_9ARAC|nr:hypothetical protein CDAR_569671 [Caerostris darwini]
MRGLLIQFWDLNSSHLISPEKKCLKTTICEMEERTFQLRIYRRFQDGCEEIIELARKFFCFSPFFRKPKELSCQPSNYLKSGSSLHSITGL